MTSEPRLDAGAAPPLPPAKEARIFTGRAARVHIAGDGLKYIKDGKIVEELRDRDALERIIPQLAGKPVTLRHPPGTKENKDGILKRGARGHIIGRIREARLDGDWAVVEFEVTEQDGLRVIRDHGIRELSLGYLRRLVEGFQRDLDVDHLAVLPEGNCGPSCTFRADAVTEVRLDCVCGCSMGDSSSEELVTEATPFGGTTGHDQGTTCTSRAMGYNSTGMETADELKAKLDAATTNVAGLQARLDQAESDRSTLQARLDQAAKDLDAVKLEAFNTQGEAKAALDARDGLQAKLDQAAKDLESAKAETVQARADAAAAIAEGVKAGVAARSKLVSQVTPIIGKNDKGEEVDLSDKTDRELKTDSVFRIDGVDLSDTKKFSETFVDAAFELAFPRFKGAEKSRASAGAQITAARNDAKTVEPITPSNQPAFMSEREAAENLRRRAAAQWQNPEKE